LLLSELEQSPSALTTAELAARARLDRTVTHRLLAALSDAGLVVGSGGRHQLGSRTVALANAYLDRLDVRNAALPYIVNLSATACHGKPWVVYLSIPVGDTAVTIDRIWSATAPLDTFLGMGTAFKLDKSAAGRSMLAFWNPERRTSLLGTIDPDLAQQLDRIRSDGGVEFNRGEHQRGICGIAAAVVTTNGDAVASIIVSGPRLGDELHVNSELAVQVHRTARSIGRTLTNSTSATDRREKSS